MTTATAPATKKPAATKPAKPAAKKAASPAKKSKPDAKKPVRREDSMTGQIEMLKVGESFVRGGRVAYSPKTVSTANENIEALARNLSVQVDRVKKANPGREYSVERTRSPSLTTANLLYGVFVTRTK